MLQTLGPGSRFDLHLHTTRSDGAFDVDEVLRRCARARLDVVALTDHDLATSVTPGAHTLEGRTLHVIAGAEVTAQHEGHELHLLVYFPDKVPEAFRHFCAEQTRARATRYADAVDNLGLDGLDGPDAPALAGERALTRLHLAHALVEAEHAASVSEAFTRYLGDRHGQVPPVGVPFVEAIRIARELGGVTSWAHPPGRLFEAYIETFAAAGLQGLEAHRPHVSRRLRKAYKKAARRYGLFLTGGSDWHGWHAPDDLGLFSVPRCDLDGFLEALAAA